MGDLSLAPSSSPSAAVNAKQGKDYRVIPDAGVEDLIWGDIASLIRYCSRAKELPPLPPCWGAHQNENTAPTLECRECLIILLRHKRDLDVPGSKFVSLGGIGSLGLRL